MQSADDIESISLTGQETDRIRIFDQIAGLNHAQYLTLSALRLIITGWVAYPRVRREFEAACGADGPQVFELFRAVIDCLARGARRPLRVGQPCFTRVIADEQHILTLVAVAQDESGASVRFDAHLCWLSRREGQSRLAITVRAFAEALARHGERLPIPSISAGRADPLHALGGLRSLPKP